MLKVRFPVILARVHYLVDKKYLFQMENSSFSESHRLWSTRILDYSIRVDTITRLLLLWMPNNYFPPKETSEKVKSWPRFPVSGRTYWVCISVLDISTNGLRAQTFCHFRWLFISQSFLFEPNAFVCRKQLATSGESARSFCNFRRLLIQSLYQACSEQRTSLTVCSLKGFLPQHPRW